MNEMKALLHQPRLPHSGFCSAAYSILTCRMMEKVPVMTAWLATMAASVARTSIGQKIRCGMEAQKM